MSSQNTPTPSIMNASSTTKVTKKVTKAVVPETVAVAVVAPVVVAEKKVTKKAVKAETVAAPAPVVAAPVVVAPTSAPVADAPAVATGPLTTLDEDVKSVVSNLTTMRETVAALMGQIKRLEKRVHREIKDARKRKRRVKVDENGVEIKRAPSIFERPTKISDELCGFLGKSKGSEMSRSEVTKAINNYVKEHNLKTKHDIKPDAPLKKLLSPPEGEQLSYFNLQKYLNKHYIKAVPVATA